MTVYKPKGGRSYRYDFWFLGERHNDITHQTTKAEAEAVEAEVKKRLRHIAGGIAVPQRTDSPRFQEWSEVFFEYKAKRLERPEALGDLLPIILRFWGRGETVDGTVRPSTPESPRHDLRLCDPINRPDWILQWETWLDARGLGAQSKNHYRGVMRRMYQVALLPEYRQRTGVMMNPFAGIPNDPTMSRDVTVTKAQLRDWLANASYHVRLAVGIGALASKLRLRNILELQWAANFDPDPRTTRFNAKVAHYIKVQRHKTARRTRRPLVVPVSAQLLRILKDAHQRQPKHTHVVVYHGEPLKSIVGGVKAAVESAGLPYGRDREDGITFHTLRHTATTLMSDQLADPLKLMDASGHTDFATTLKYRHARPSSQRPTFERFSRSMKIEDIVTRPRERATRK